MRGPAGVVQRAQEGEEREGGRERRGREGEEKEGGRERRGREGGGGGERDRSSAVVTSPSTFCTVSLRDGCRDCCRSDRRDCCHERRRDRGHERRRFRCHERRRDRCRDRCRDCCHERQCICSTRNSREMISPDHRMSASRQKCASTKPTPPDSPAATWDTRRQEAPMPLEIRTRCHERRRDRCRDCCRDRAATAASTGS